MHGYAHTFPALRGIQGGHPYYVAMCPLKLLPKLFLFDDKELPVEMRAQRVLNQARIPEICHYILENKQDYVFSAITASIDGEVTFEPAAAVDGDFGIGSLIVPMSARFIINDGQHRRAAIEAALEECPELGEETIGVVFYLDTGLQRSQQIFADLNKHAARPTGSLGILYDFRDPLACLARDLTDQAPIFKGLTEKAKTVIAPRSIKLFTLSGVYAATGALLHKHRRQTISPDETKLAFRYWNELCRVIPEWQMACKHTASPVELRRDTICVHNVTLLAFGIAGNQLIKKFPEEWPSRLQALCKVDWSRTNRMWEGRATTNGKINNNRQAAELTAVKLRAMMGLPLNPKEVWLA
ncbi:MAG: DNA sulfur modification protein DndB [Anaerolineaceae bacterium]|nr:DNA sulfur modification protein DndB [Anaerolineaceae bacterium]